MNFQKISPVPTAKQLIDICAGEARKAGTDKRIESFVKALTRHLTKHASDFPSFDGMSEFYNEATKLLIDIDYIKKSLYNITWCRDKIKSLSYQYIKKGEKYTSFLGRASSIINGIGKNLEALEDARKKLKDLPDIKDLFTVCIAGFPNVGKSTLLSKITSSRPEIKAYPFTTKRLNTGYFTQRFRKVQVIDTPGTLARYEKMNQIEKMAYLAIKYKADLIVFVIDPTEHDFGPQTRLFEYVSSFRKDILVYVSKSDIAESQKISEALTLFSGLPSFSSAEELKRAIVGRL